MRNDQSRKTLVEDRPRSQAKSRSSSESSFQSLIKTFLFEISGEAASLVVSQIKTSLFS